MKRKLSRVKVERLTEFVSTFYVSFGIAIVTGVILTLSRQRPVLSDWNFLVLGFTMLLSGYYIRFTKPKNMNKERIRRYGNLLNLFSVVIFVVYSLIEFLLLKDVYGGIAFLLMLGILMFFFNLNKNRK